MTNKKMVSVPMFFRFKSQDTRPTLVALTFIGLIIVAAAIVITL